MSSLIFYIYEFINFKKEANVTKRFFDILLKKIYSKGSNYYFGWWLYWAFPNGPFIKGGIDFAAGEANTAMFSTMGANLGDRITGVFWAAFLLFSWTAASIVSGSVI